MENLNVPFSIDETSGELFTTNVLDRETVAVYRLTVIGSDKDPAQPLSSSVLVMVLVGDINDQWPQFMNSPYVAYVPTEMAPGEGFHFHLTANYFIDTIKNYSLGVLMFLWTFVSHRLSRLCSQSNGWRL